MMQTVQLSIADGGYAATVRDALTRSCAWHVESVEHPDFSRHCVLVLDGESFARVSLPLSNPERVVLITHKEPPFLAQAWDAGIVSVVSMDDPLSTVLLAIMAAALRIAKTGEATAQSGISPNERPDSAQLAPEHRVGSTKRCKIQ